MNSEYIIYCSSTHLHTHIHGLYTQTTGKDSETRYNTSLADPGGYMGSEDPLKNLQAPPNARHVAPERQNLSIH